MAYCQYFLHDIIAIDNDAKMRETMAKVVIIAQTTAGIVSWPAGKFSDMVGRKPMVYVSTVFMCLAYWGYGLVANLWSGGGADSTGMYVVYLTSFCYGCGNGCYISVDLALAIDCIPNKKQKAKDLGVWGVAAFIGSALGPGLWMLIMIWSSGDGCPHAHNNVSNATRIAHGIEDVGAENAAAAEDVVIDTCYSALGYTIMFAVGCVFAAMAGILVAFIKGSR